MKKRHIETTEIMPAQANRDIWDDEKEDKIWLKYLAGQNKSAGETVSFKNIPEKTERFIREYAKKNNSTMSVALGEIVRLAFEHLYLCKGKEKYKKIYDYYAERREQLGWFLLSQESLARTWDNREDEKMSKFYLKQFKKGVYNRKPRKK